MKNVIIAITRYVPEDKDQMQRLEKLHDGPWKKMSADGARISLYDGSKTSANVIVALLLDRIPARIDAVYDLAERQTPWQETPLGKALDENTNDIVKMLESRRTAVEKNLKELKLRVAATKGSAEWTNDIARAVTELDALEEHISAVKEYQQREKRHFVVKDDEVRELF